MGLATSQNPANDLLGEGLTTTWTIAVWRAAITRVGEGQGSTGDAALAPRGDDLLIVDEAAWLEAAVQPVSGPGGATAGSLDHENAQVRWGTPPETRTRNPLVVRHVLSPLA